MYRRKQAKLYTFNRPGIRVKMNMGEKAAFGLFGGAFCDPVLYGTRARGPGVFIKTQKPSNFSKTVGPR